MKFEGKTVAELALVLTHQPHLLSASLATMDKG